MSHDCHVMYLSCHVTYLSCHMTHLSCHVTHMYICYNSTPNEKLLGQLVKEKVSCVLIFVIFMYNTHTMYTHRVQHTPHTHIHTTHTHTIQHNTIPTPCTHTTHTHTHTHTPYLYHSMAQTSTYWTNTLSLFGHFTPCLTQQTRCVSPL